MPWEGRRVPFLTEHRVGGVRIAVLNVHTFSQEDFDAVKEVLLAPAPLGLTQLPREWADAVRGVFRDTEDTILSAPAGVAFQPTGTKAWVIQNYNREKVGVVLDLEGEGCADRIGGEVFEASGKSVSLTLPARGRVWLEGTE